MREIVRRGLERTSGSYKLVSQLFNMPPQDHKRFLAFLRKDPCHMPFQQFRSAAALRPEGSGDSAIDAERDSPISV